MPLTRLAADAFGVVTICLVSLLVLFGLFCIFYSALFRSRIQRHGYVQLGYFNGPWIIRLTLIIIAIWWGLGEIVRLSLLKGRGRILHAVSLKWQENLCKFYILSNLGFAEPSMFLTLIFLLHASLQRRELGTLSRQWNRKTFSYVVLFCLPMFVAQLVLVLTGPKLNNNKASYMKKMPKYFTTMSIEGYSKVDIALCTYPLLSTILLGLFSFLLIAYFLYIGVRMVSLVINKGLRRRVLLLIFSVVSFLPLRVLFLGFSVLSQPGHLAFEAVVFLAFLMLLLCAAVGICMLVYCPISDSLAVRSLQLLETEGAFDSNDSSSLIANQSLLEAASSTSAGRNSDASMKGGSISFRTMIKDSAPTEGFEELGLFSATTPCLPSSPGSPPLPGRPMIPLREVSEC
ncbi:uncharacterized protein LOC131236717 [Magnolia sinica]|uniref:uncharacterized protein LOC131236717 n=1 Tax=Magnolia sinica TaxID=86752 RepID=UPI00265A59D3|nr:uncharacterized protein LOC131236717 [Magnolia sinica]XP_058090086.1 uncharacterized protein LOC131236717 [Magnolia sinica]